MWQDRASESRSTEMSFSIEEPRGGDWGRGYDERQRDRVRAKTVFDDVVAELTQQARDMASAPQHFYADVLRTKPGRHSVRTLKDIREAVQGRVGDILGAMHGKRGSLVHVSADARMVVVLKGHRMQLCLRAMGAALRKIVELNEAGVSGLLLGWNTLVLLSRTFPNEELDRVTLALLRPRLPRHMRAGLRACLPWVTWDNPLPYDAERAAHIDPYARTDDGIGNWCHYASIEFRLKDLRAVSAGETATVVLSCTSREEAEWLANRMHPTDSAAFIDRNGRWFARSSSKPVVGYQSQPGIFDGEMLDGARSPVDSWYPIMATHSDHALLVSHGFALAEKANMLSSGYMDDPQHRLTLDISYMFSVGRWYEFMTLLTARDDRIQDVADEVLEVADLSGIVVEYADEFSHMKGE